MIDKAPAPVKATLQKMNVDHAVEKISGVLLHASPSAHRAVSKPLMRGPYRGALVDEIVDGIYELEVGETDQAVLIERIRDRTAEAIEHGELNGWLDQGQLLAGAPFHSPHKSWYLQRFHIEEGEQDLPHHHHNLTSFQAIVEGKLRLREYDRVERVDDTTIRIKQVTDTVLEAGDSFITTETDRNVHWFAPVNGDVVTMNFNIRGFWDETFNEQPKSPGRHYLVPEDEPDKDGLLFARETSQQVAENELELLTDDGVGSVLDTY